MRRLALRYSVSRPLRWFTSMLAFAPVCAFAQDISVVRLPQSTDMTVRLRNLTTHVNYDTSGESYLIVPAGRYSIQLLRQGQIAYEEVEFISSNSPQSRTVNPEAKNIVVGLSGGNPQFEAGLCSTLETAARLAITSYGFRDDSVDRRLARATSGAASTDCNTLQGLTFFTAVLAGSYGVTPLGMLNLSIDFTSLAPQRRPPNRGNSPIYKDPATQRLATTQKPGANLTPELVSDLKNGISDVAVDDAGKSLLVCGAIDANTPLFCDSNGFAVATPAIARLRGLYRFQMKTTAVDRQGVEDDHWTTFVTEEEYRTTQQKLVAALLPIQQNLTQRIAHVEAGAVTVPSASAAEQAGRYYATTDILSLIAATQKEIDLALSNNTLHALQQYFSPLVASVDPNLHAVEQNQAHKIFRDLQNSVTLLTTVSNTLDFDFVFRTTPVETEGAHLNFDNCERCNPVISQGGEHRFYRGKYHVRATLDGYVPYEGWLDLVDDPRTIFECNLVRAIPHVNSQASSCALKTQ